MDDGRTSSLARSDLGSGARGRAAATDGAAVTGRALDCLAAGLLVARRGTIEYANPRAHALLGRERLVGTTLDDLGLGTDVAAQGEPTRFELEIHPSGHPRRQLGFTVSSCGDDPNGETRLVLFQDISQLTTLRQERDRLLQLAAINAVLPSILHEIRNPIGAITTTIEVMIEEAPAATQADLHAILTVLRQLSLTLQGVGAVGRELRCDRPCVVDLPIEEAARVLEAKARSRGVSLVCRVESMPLLALDPAVLRAIVGNLVENALAATASGGRVLVTAQYGAGMFRLRVRDNGRGMDPEVLAHATDLFFTTKPLGSGIGLSLCARAVETAGGQLRIDSNVGLGTTVDIELPIASDR